jgi:hypothetical protein
MEYFTLLLYTLLFLIITIPITVTIFDFFDVQFSAYGSYLIWFVALALFNAFLPYKQKNVLAK